MIRALTGSRRAACARPPAATADADTVRERLRQLRDRQARADGAAEVLTEGRIFKPRRQVGRE